MNVGINQILLILGLQITSKKVTVLQISTNFPQVVLKCESAAVLCDIQNEYLNKSGTKVYHFKAIILAFYPLLGCDYSM